VKKASGLEKKTTGLLVGNHRETPGGEGAYLAGKGKGSLLRIQKSKAMGRDTSREKKKGLVTILGVSFTL